MSSKYPKSWREVKDDQGAVLWHERLCGQYTVLPVYRGTKFDCFNEQTLIGTKDSLSSAMAFCREHLDRVLSTNTGVSAP